MKMMCKLNLLEDYLSDWRTLDQKMKAVFNYYYVHEVVIETHFAYCEDCDEELVWPVLIVTDKRKRIDEDANHRHIEKERYADVLERLQDACDRVHSDYGKYNSRFFHASPFLCPICGASIPYSNDHSSPYRSAYISVKTIWIYKMNVGSLNKGTEICRTYTKEDINKKIFDSLEEMKNKRKDIIDNENQNKAKQYSMSMIKDFQTKNEKNDDDNVWSAINRDVIKETPERLKTFLTDVMKMETSIIGLSQRLEKLYKGKKIAELIHEGEMRLKVKQKRKKERDAISLEDKIKHYSPTMESLGISSPEEPDRVLEPVLEKPGLFNKKKVEANNRKIMDAYQEKVKEYNIRYQEYEKALMLNKQLYEKRKEDSKRELEEELESIRNEILCLSQDVLVKSPVVLMIDREIETAEKLLQETYTQRNIFYNLDIIYAKYRNPVALASFCEYLVSGRCTELEGPSGAYNIYENEIRLDHIIDQLDKVIDSLEQIKKNQYMIYNELVQMNSTLQSLDESFNEAVDSLKEIEENGRITNIRMGEIEHNTAVTAYYSKINAYYSKKTAENTKALAWLVALK